MQRDIIVKGRSLGGTSDLTLLAPIKPGFVESLESVTYKTRVKRVLDTLHGARVSSHEYATARLLSDSVERVGAIHSVRVAVLEPDDKVLLAVTFDGSWEAYIRVLWDKVGTLLDLIFCSTVGYVTAYDHSFDEWLQWARRVQAETGFFYGPAEATARDVLYQRRIEYMRQRGAGTAYNELRAVLPSAEEEQKRLVGTLPTLIDGERTADEPPYDWGPSIPDARTRMVREQMRMGMRSLAALYQLTDLFRPTTPDGEVLRLAARDLLSEFVKIRNIARTEWKEESEDSYAGEVRVPARFLRQVSWLMSSGSTLRAPRPDKPVPDQLQNAQLSEIQGGILEPFTDIDRGAVVLVALHTREAAAAFFRWAAGHVTKAPDPHSGASEPVFRTVAVTPAGLRACGLSEDEVELFPEEFRQGMAARSGLLGDVRHNSPRRWRLPQRLGAHEPGFTVDLESVHAVVVFRSRGTSDEEGTGETPQSGEVIEAELESLGSLHTDVEILAVQAMARQFKDWPSTDDPEQSVRKIVEHFGYADGESDPDLKPVSPPFDNNLVHLGEVVNGYPNAADVAPPEPGDPKLQRGQALRMQWLRNGSFLILRKYRQFAYRYEQAVASASSEVARRLGMTQPEADDLVYAKLLGRFRNAQPLVHGKGINNFSYTDDPQGRLCPLHAHIRLANPRNPDAMARPPRIMRRGMSYGPAHVQGTDDDEEDRGLVFMAYNANIGEQFEVMQRWLVGGNSTGSSSGTSCPILGVAENGYPRHFRFEHKPEQKPPLPDSEDQVYTAQMEGNRELFDEPLPVTRLDWGMYLFTPSVGVLARLARRAECEAAPPPWRARRGREILAGLFAIEKEQGPEAALLAWKAAIEDPVAIDRLESASLWSAIREDHGGVLRTPYGTLVASRDLLHEVFLDAHQRYSVSGQMERMKRSFGPISLGLDAGTDYDQQSQPVNDAIRGLTNTITKKVGVFHIAFKAAVNKIEDIVAHAAKYPTGPRLDAGFDAREVVDEVLADLSEHWFGLRDGLCLRRGGADLAWQERDPPLPPYPGHFTALSRFMFQPQPGAMPIELGEAYGQALRNAMGEFVRYWRAQGLHVFPLAPDGTVAPISRAIFTHPMGQRADPAIPDDSDDFVARMIVGVLMGFNPTIIGAVLNVIREWQRDGTFGSLRSRLGTALDDGGPLDFDNAHEILETAMRNGARMRPMPQIAWRTVRKEHRLGVGTAGVELSVGDKVVLAIVSGTQQSLEEGRDDGLLMFGGDRRLDPHPTHACPGYEAGIEAMLGTLAAVLTRPGVLRQGPGWLNFVLERDVQWPELDEQEELEAIFGAEHGVQVLHAKHEQDLEAELELAPQDAKEAERNKRLAQLPTGRVGVVLGWGDSWVSYGKDLHLQLRGFGYTVPDDLCDWGQWKYLQTMAESDGTDFQRLAARYQTSQVPPVAILLSGGGNDAVETPLAQMLNPPDAADFFKPTEHDNLLKNLKNWYMQVIEHVLPAAEEFNVPVILHGYDHPYATPVIPSWLWGPFHDARYDLFFNAAHRKRAHDAMTLLINQLNTMIGDIAGSDRYKSRVRHVDITGTLAEYWEDPANAWANALHPVNDGFALMAAKIDAAIQKK